MNKKEMLNKFEDHLAVNCADYIVGDLYALDDNCVKYIILPTDIINTFDCFDSYQTYLINEFCLNPVVYIGDVQRSINNICHYFNIDDLCVRRKFMYNNVIFTMCKRYQEYYTIYKYSEELMNTINTFKKVI